VAKSIYTEQELLRLAANGDEAAFTILFNLYKHRLYSYLLKLSGSAEMTEDVIQEIFLKLWDQRTSMGKIEQFGAYIFRMAQHRIVNSFKRSAKETLILAELRRQTKAPVSEAEDNLSAREVQLRFHEALQKLSPRQKLIYQLSRDQGLKHDEIAQRLHISRSTVNNHMILALRMIRDHLGPVTAILAGICHHFYRF
jgi:RNA polymerase sigma-19 factor, ECF subfamily